LRILATLITCVHLSLCPQQVSSQDFLRQTSLLSVNVGSGRSEIARALSSGGYELSDGTPINFSDWYEPKFPDLNLLFLTEITSSFALSWGFSLGERGEKYQIDPGLWLGFIYRTPLNEHSSLTISGITLIGGDFREHECVGIYSFDERSVNCRLAASVLAPADTLKFLINEPGFRETRLSIRYEFWF
jgi:hypothetical protein